MVHNILNTKEPEYMYQRIAKTILILTEVTWEENWDKNQIEKGTLHSLQTSSAV